jgi:outer membrane protein OmpA-like peptidoglycan-associated protein
MFRKVVLSIAAMIMIGCASSSFAYDTWGSRDHPLFRRPYGYDIADYVVRDGVLRIAGNPAFLSGKVTEITYYTQGRPLSPSELMLRFTASLQKAGGEILFQEEPGLGGRYAAGKLSRPNRDVWVVQESTALREYRLTFLETSKGASRPLPAAVNHETEAQVLDLLHTVDRTGVLEFPARFASNSSALATGYEAGFKKIVMLMEKDSSLQFRVSTYTDSDLKPSEQRALLRERGAKLVDTLVNMGADKGRLTIDLSADETASRGVVRLTSVDSVDSSTQ